MLGVRVSEDIENRLLNLATQTNRSKSFFIKEALARYLDDLEDIYLSEKVIEEIRAGKRNTTDWADVKKELFK